MVQSAEEKSAHDALNDAIEKVITLTTIREAGQRRGVLTEWIVVAAEVLPSDTIEESAYSVIMTNGGIPWHRAEGLLRAGLRYLYIDEDEEE